jgi:uncharacterized membrane protein YraQ (UPF0718 family)
MGQKTGGPPSIRNTVSYLKIVWPALVFGVMISAAARTSLSRMPLGITVWGRGVVRDQLSGALAGTPLMLCSCCVAPIFPAIYQRTGRLAPSLALALASPSLNPVALTLSFVLFPVRIASARLVMALTLVLIGSALAAKVTRSWNWPKEYEEERPGTSWPDLLLSYGRSLSYVSLRTVPLVVVGIWASMWISQRLSFAFAIGTGTHILGIAVIALIALLLTLPSLFEIPLALSLLAAGGPIGGAAAILFAGPAINVPSLLVIGRYSNWRVAAALGLVVWVIAVIGGLLLR